MAILQEHKREAGITKAKRKDPQMASLIRDLERKFEKALKSGDDHNMHRFDREIDKTYKKIGVTE